jgi:hypothetical protein
MAEQFCDISSAPGSNRLLMVAGPLGQTYQIYKEQKKSEQQEAIGGGGILSDGNVFLAAGGALGKAVIETTIGLTNIGKKNASQVFGRALEGLSRTSLPGSSQERVSSIDNEHSTQHAKLRPIRYGDVVYITPVTSDTEQRSDTFLLNGLLTTESVFIHRSYVAEVTKDWEIQTPWLSLYRIQNISSSRGTSSSSSSTHTTDESTSAQEIQIVQQGESFLLQQLYSDMFLCSTIDDQIADVEKDCLKLSVVIAEDPSCHFTMRPKYITRSNGAIYYEDQVTIINLKTMFELHLGGEKSCYGCADLETLGNVKHIEVNLYPPVATLVGGAISYSTSGTIKKKAIRGTSTWRLHLYSGDGSSVVSPSPSESSSSSNEIQVGDFVRIHHLNHDAYLWSSMNKKIINRPYFNLRKRHFLDRLSQNGSPLLGQDNEQEKDPLLTNKSQGLIFNKPPQFILNDPMASTTVKTIFRIEKLSVLNGGKVYWSNRDSSDGTSNHSHSDESHFYRLRHVTSGCYLTVLKVGYGADAYVTKLSKPSQWGHLSKKSILKYLYGTLFQFHPTSDLATLSSKQVISWKDSMMKIVHIPITPPDEKFFDFIVSAQNFSSSQILIQVNDRCIPFSTRHHMSLITSLPVVLTAGNMRPRAKKTYPSISTSQPQSLRKKPTASLNSFAQMNLPHKAEVKFIISEKENDTIGLEQPSRLDRIAAIASVSSHQYFNRFEDAWYLHLTSKHGGKPFPTDSLFEISAALRMNIAFLRVEDRKKFHVVENNNFENDNEGAAPVPGNGWRNSGNEKKTFLDSVTTAQSDTANGLLEMRMRNQFFNYTLRLLDRVYWLLRLPTVLGTSWLTEIASHPELQPIYEMLNTSATYAAVGHPIVQDYIARSSYSDWRASEPANIRLNSTEISLQSGNVTTIGVTAEAGGEKTRQNDSKDSGPPQIGFLVELNQQLGSNPYAANILKVTLTENRELLLELVCDHFIHDCITIIRRYGPSKHVLEILANICCGAGTPLMMTQEIVLNTLYSSSEVKAYLENRLALTIESIYYHDMENADLSTPPLSPLFVTWHGSKNYLLGDNLGSELFFDIESLQLPFVEANIPTDLERYFQRIDLEKKSLKWVNLVDLAWYIDPEHCCQFWVGDPRSQWEEKKAMMLKDPQLMDNAEYLKQIALHCYGVFDVASKLCSGRR